MTNYLLLLFLYIVWGTTYTAISFALKGFTPLVMASMRYLICGLFFLPWTTRSDWKWQKAWPQVLGGICLVFANSLVMWSQQTMPSGLASLFIATVPLWFLLVNGLFFEKKVPNKVAIIGVIVGIAGVGFLSYVTGKDLSLRAGAVALVSASLIWVIGSMFIRRSMAEYKTFPAISVQLTSGGIFLVILSLFSEETYSSNLTHGNFGAWAGFFYLTIAGSLMALTVYNKLLQRLPPHVVGTYALVNPMVAMLLGQMVLGEVLTVDMLLATLMVLGGVALIIYSNYLSDLRRSK